MTDDGDDESLIALARAIAAGEPIQWDRQDRSLDADPGVLDALQGLHRIADAHRRIQESPVLDASRWAHLAIVEKRLTGRSTVQCRARDALGRSVSLLLLGPLHGDAADVERLLKEARLRTGVHHPHLATVYGADYAQDYVGLWSEDLPGQTLEELVQSKGSLDGEEAGRILRDLCGAVSALHHAGLVHGDIRPGTVTRSTDGRIVLAPAVSADATAASDILGLGLTLQHLLGGRERVSRDLIRIAERATLANTGERFRNAADVDAALERALRPRWTGREWLIGFIAAALLAGAIIWLTIS
jgi:hypothetical protein